MKKSIVFATLFAVVMGAWAQEMKVQSAYSDMKNERLSYAKKNIDAAIKHEKTKDEVKTWAYAGLIYAQIVSEANNKDASKSIKKQLKQIETPMEDICQQGIEHLKKAIDMEQKAGTHEYSAIAIDALKTLCYAEAIYAGNAYNAGEDYAKAAQMWEKLVKDAEFANVGKLVDDGLYYQADCYRMLKQKDKELELYRALAKKDTKRADVYLKIYIANKEAKDTIKAINALKKGVRITEKDTTNVNIILKTELASAYLWAGKNTDADKLLNEMIANSSNNTTALNGIARIYSEQGDLAKAEEFYNKSLNIDAAQIDALRGKGNAYFNKALKEHKVADAIPLEEVEAYDKKIKEVYGIYEKSIPFYEKALKVNENDFESLNKLRLVYSIFNARTDVDAATKQAYKEKFQFYDTAAKQVSKGHHEESK